MQFELCLPFLNLNIFLWIYIIINISFLRTGMNFFLIFERLCWNSDCFFNQPYEYNI